jgi:glycerol-3-phosphate dehydrogenase
MKRDIDKLTEKEFDVLVIGAGMFGACAAWEAAHRGLNVALIDKGDFCNATSANHFKMVHGGIRYLQHADIYRVRESSRERSAFLRVAPHLVSPLPILIPTYGHGMKGKEVLGIGMSLYDLVTADRNIGINDQDRQIPDCRFVPKKKVLEMFPGIKRNNLTGAAIFSDAQMYNPPRLALSFIRSAVETEAVAVNYLEATGFVFKGNKVCRVKAHDLINNNNIEIKAKVVLNTVGPWTDDLLQKGAGINLDKKPAFSRDSAFVIKRSPINKYALATTLKTKDADSIIDRGGRHVFIVPWLDKNVTLIGVWHIVWGGSKDRVFINEDELEGFIDEVNEAYPEIDLSVDDISMVNTGLTLFGESTPGSTRMSFGKRSILIDHQKAHSIEGLITVIGVRATIARGMAEKAVNMISKKLNVNIADSKSEKIPVYGGNTGPFNEFFEKAVTENPSISKETILALTRNYGSEYKKVLNFAKGDKSLAGNIGSSTILKAEVVHAIRDEMAQNLSDIVFRRTDLCTSGNPGVNVLIECAETAAKEFKWNEEKTGKEISSIRQFLKLNGSIKEYATAKDKAEVII